MKSPKQLAKYLANQWLLADHRERRLLADFDWPIRLSIGKPDARLLSNDLQQVKQHRERWQSQAIGRVEWRPIKYQSASEVIKMPLYWLIDSPEQWVSAAAPEAKTEFERLKNILQAINPIFHQLMVRHRSKWSNANAESSRRLIPCCQLAMQLQPEMAMGQPLRALSLSDFDSKFIENHRELLTQLLNIRFAGQLENQGLEKFLGATQKGLHWLLVKPLSEGLLPFEQLRLTSAELAQIDLPAEHLVVVENEQCLHQLPKMENTIAILGSGLDLLWLKNSNFSRKQITYWGDIDSWGLKMLSMARKHQPQLNTLLMDLETFQQHQSLAVVEPTNAGDEVPLNLSETERHLYQILINSDKGRLEQERLPAGLVKAKFLAQLSR